MADSIKITFLPGTSLELNMFCDTGDPSFSEIKSFFQDITHVLTPEELQSDDILLTVPHYEAALKAYNDMNDPVELGVEYSVFDGSQVSLNQLQILVTNDFTEQPPSLQIQIGDNNEHLLFNGSSMVGANKVEITFFKDGDSKTVPEPEVYPSVARSLDKLVDKMEGNTVEVPGDEKVFETGFRYNTRYIMADGEVPVFSKLDGTINELLPAWNEQECTVQLLHSGEVINTFPMTLVTEHDNFGGVDFTITEYVYGTDLMLDYIKIVLSVLDENGKTPGYYHYLSDISENDIAVRGSCLRFFSDLPDSGNTMASSGDYTLRFIGGQTSKTIPAYETYKEAVPSVERSMWKIAELYGTNKDSITLGNTTLTESDLAKLLSIINDQD